MEKARASNRNIVFEMGHSSIAEHAVFNLDVLKVSRLLVEEIERFRLASYTEKSQRYVLFQDDFVIPAEVREAGLEEAFVAAVRMQNDFYHALYEKLRPWVFDRNPGLAADPANRLLLEGWAKEDARYCLPLATETQLGMTVNARNIELMIRRLAASPLKEGHEYSRLLYEATQGCRPVARPLHGTDPLRLRDAGGASGGGGRDHLDKWTAVPSAADGKAERSDRKQAGAGTADELVRLLDATPAADEKIAAALLHSASNLPLAECLRIAACMEPYEKESLIKTALRRMKAYDVAPREFEYAGLTFELVISATCFAQVKRHRMATITVQGYDPALGVTIPPSIAADRHGKRVPRDLRPDGGDLGEDPPPFARRGRLHPDERPSAPGHDEGQRPRAVSSRPRPGGPPRPVGYPGDGRADGRTGAEGDAAHADPRRGEGRL